MSLDNQTRLATKPVSGVHKGHNCGLYIMSSESTRRISTVVNKLPAIVSTLLLQLNLCTNLHELLFVEDCKRLWRLLN